MKFSAIERLLVLNLDTMPMTGNIITMKVKNELLSAIGFSDEEITSHNLRQEENGSIKWDGEIKDKEIEVGEQGIKLIIDAIEKSNNLSSQFVPFYERIKSIQEAKDGIQ